MERWMLRVVVAVNVIVGTRNRVQDVHFDARFDEAAGNSCGDAIVLRQAKKLWSATHNFLSAAHMPTSHLCIY